ncbi:MAG: prepilin peptidase [Candidatus Saccharibacteria bacterium]
MEQFLVYMSLIIFGLCFGSFAGATMWRLRAKQLIQDKKDGEHVNKAEYSRLNKLTKTSLLNDHSMCLNCTYQLKWYDLIPLVSWLSLKGRCRKCHKPIGNLEPLIEIGLALFFVISYAFWPYQLDSSFEILRLILWLLSGVGLAIVFAYDKLWSLIPDQVNYSVIGIGFVSALLVIFNSSNIMESSFSVIGAILILSGLYLFIYIISSGMWIGFGDIKLGLGLALLLADWKLAFIALFAANLFGCLIVIPAMLIGKLKRNSHVPFGPLLIIGFVFAGLFGSYLLNTYFYSLL